MDSIAIVIIIIGWIVVHFATLSREKRKEKREIALSLIEEIELTEKTAITFQSSSLFNQQSRDTLLWKISRIINKLQRLPLKHLHVRLELMTKFRQKLTDNTDRSTFITQEFDGKIVQNIHEITDELIDEIELGMGEFFS